METPETLEYYKLKDELTRILKDEITRSLSNERDLQQRYIGVGLKIAAAGVAAAVLTLGVFGIKSVDEINTAIKKIPEVINTHVNNEIQARFNNNNPVAQYEMMLRESAARSIAVSLTMQAQRSSPTLLDERTSNLIATVMGDPSVRQTTTLSLISALTAEKIHLIPSVIDQAVIAFALQMSNDPSTNEQTIRRFLSYFSIRTPERYAADVEKILETHNGIPELRLAVARYTLSLPKNYGDGLAKKLEISGAADIGYLLHVRDLTLGRIKEPRRELFASTLDRALQNSNPDDGITFSEMIEQASSFDDGIGAPFAELIREHARSHQLTLAVEDDSQEDLTFNLYTSEAKRAARGIDQDHFRKLLNLALIRLKTDLIQSKGELTDEIRQWMDFWLPIADKDDGLNSRKAGVFRLNDITAVRFGNADGQVIDGNSLAKRAFLFPQASGVDHIVLLKWYDEFGISKSMPVQAIYGLDPDKLGTYGIWSRAASSDD